LKYGGETKKGYHGVVTEEKISRKKKDRHFFGESPLEVFGQSFRVEKPGGVPTEGRQRTFPQPVKSNWSLRGSVFEGSSKCKKRT